MMRLTLCAVVLVCAGTLHAEAITLIAPDKPAGGWGFANGAEFPGATGTLTLSDDKPPALVLHGDFTKGGNYVAASVSPPRVNADTLSFKMKAKGLSHVTVRIVDDTDQCHQIDIKIAPGDDWQQIDFPVLEFFRKMGTSASLPNVGRYEKWGGANDGKWHGPCRHISFLVGHTPTAKVVELSLRDVSIYPSEGVMFSETFDAGAPLPKGWESQGDVSLDDAAPHKGSKSLKFSRTVEKIQVETMARGPAFAATPGTWQISGAIKAELNSLDNSYNGEVSVEAIGADGRPFEWITVAEVFKNSDWRAFDKKIELPVNTTQARIRVRMNKADGSFWLDDLTASRLPVMVEKRISRIEISMKDHCGNLLGPEAKPIAHVRVQALRLLKDDELTLNWCVHDYWGAEQYDLREARLVPDGKDRSYAVDLDLTPMALELGRYYEIHVELPRAVEPETEFSGVARLREPVTLKYPPNEIPFTIRNWDSRIPVYFLLARSLGHRTIGLWAGFAPNPPYTPSAPGIESMKPQWQNWISTLPSQDVEAHGFKNYSEEALREGTQVFLKEFGHENLGFIALGNEPHGKLEKVKENVKAYRAVYEEIKKFDPKITVIGTSVEPNEDYFNEGYYHWLDMYDFHVYGSYHEVRSTMKKYKELMEKYKAVKPLVSTELGLNSQGMPRLAVATEMAKTFSVFFAEGGVNASWFTIQYPDPNGTARGSSGDAHCVFDCKYSLYNPRIDAVMYYTLINGICIKKFKEEKTYPDGTQAYLFTDKDGACMICLWNDSGRKDVAMPLGVETVDLVWVDGRRVTLSPDKAGPTLTAPIEPVLLFFTQKDAKLPEALGPPALTMTSEPNTAPKGKDAVFHLSGPIAEMIGVVAPPLWSTRPRNENGGIDLTVKVPAKTAARVGRVYARTLGPGNKPTGEILLQLPIEQK